MGGSTARKKKRRGLFPAATWDVQLAGGYWPVWRFLESH
jgi:hypothetical protein